MITNECNNGDNGGHYVDDVLTPSQIMCHNDIMTHIKRSSYKSLPRVNMINGPPGAGKSKILPQLIQSLCQENPKLKNQIFAIGRTHSTVKTMRLCIGPYLPAVNFYTFHKFMNYHIQKNSTDTPAPTPYMDKKMRLWKSAKVILIDEITQMKAIELLFLDACLRILNNHKIIFGGIVVLFLGDNNQNSSFDKSSLLDTDLCFKNYGLETIHAIYLKQNKRIKHAHMIYVQRYYNHFFNEIILRDTNISIITQCTSLLYDSEDNIQDIILSEAELEKSQQQSIIILDDADDIDNQCLSSTLLETPPPPKKIKKVICEDQQQFIDESDKTYPQFISSRCNVTFLNSLKRIDPYSDPLALSMALSLFTTGDFNFTLKAISPQWKQFGQQCFTNSMVRRIVSIEEMYTCALSSNSADIINFLKQNKGFMESNILKAHLVFQWISLIKTNRSATFISSSKRSVNEYMNSFVLFLRQSQSKLEKKNLKYAIFIPIVTVKIGRNEHDISSSEKIKNNIKFANCHKIKFGMKYIDEKLISISRFDLWFDEFKNHIR